MGAPAREASPRVAFATYSTLPDGSPDDQPALESLRARGVDASAQVWNSPTVDWSAFDAIVLRSTWDYFRDLPGFLAWLDRIARSSQVWNPVESLRWNLHKSYLVELASHGLAVVPTELVRQGSPATLASICEARGWSEVAVKPAVGGNAYRFLRVGTTNQPAGEVHLRDLVSEGDALVQAFLPSAGVRGERSLVYIEGLFSHAVRYRSVLEEPVREPVAVQPDRAELTEGGRVLADLPTTPLYARLDYLPDTDGTWKLGELEIVEPELFFRSAPGAPDRFAAALLRRLGR